MGDYGSEADRINDMVRQHKDAYTAGLSDEANSLQTLATENWNSQSADYLSKYGHLAEGGGAEVAGAFGLKGVYKGGQKLKTLYSKYQSKSSDGQDPLVENETANPTGANNEVPENLRPEDTPEVAQTGEAPTISTDQIASEDAFNFIRTEGNPDIPLSQTAPLEGADTQPNLVEVGNEGLGTTEETDLPQINPRPAPAQSSEDLFEDAPEEPTTAPPVDEIQPAPTEAPLAGETENVVEQTAKATAEKATEEVGEGVVDKGLTSGLGDLVAGAIPIVGEAVLGVAGLVSIGEGIYHLFHHKDKQPVVNTLPTGGVAQPSNNLTQKYSLALPSIDTASEQSASVSSF